MLCVGVKKNDLAKSHNTRSNFFTLSCNFKYCTVMYERPRSDSKESSYIKHDSLHSKPTYREKTKGAKRRGHLCNTLPTMTQKVKWRMFCIKTQGVAIGVGGKYDVLPHSQFHLTLLQSQNDCATSRILLSKNVCPKICPTRNRGLKVK